MIRTDVKFSAFVEPGLRVLATVRFLGLGRQGSLVGGSVGGGELLRHLGWRLGQRGVRGWWSGHGT